MKDYLLYPLERLFAIWGNEVTDYTNQQIKKFIYLSKNYLSEIIMKLTIAVRNDQTKSTLPIEPLYLN